MLKHPIYSYMTQISLCHYGFEKENLFAFVRCLVISKSAWKEKLVQNYPKLPDDDDNDTHSKKILFEQSIEGGCLNSWP